MRRSQSYKLIPTPEDLVTKFLAEACAAAAGVEPGKFSMEELGKLWGERRYGDAEDDLFAFFDSLKPYREFSDFQMLAELRRPRPLRLHIDPSILYGHFRAWLRREGIEPDNIGELGTIAI
jgi:hypothetical protein